MNFREHEQQRTWIISALQKLNQFVRLDPDFRGDKPYQLKAINYQRRFLEDGKYRVVFLGTFNVGKSTAINAFLGGAYLPMDVEECTSRLTFIQRGEQQRLIVTLNQAAAPGECESLERLFADIPASVVTENDDRELHISYTNDSPEAMCRSLEPLVTVLADEECPHLAPLREKIEELNLYLPSSVLEEDIVIVDTPGVHTVSETRQEITYGIIEHSHLVIDFVDSGFAANVHDLNFIKRIITCRGRRVFFVLNKADKLDPDEIDPRASRGPARDLLAAFRRHDIPEDSEMFFLSGYRALRAQQLALGHISLEDVLEDNRVSLPTSVVQRIQQSTDPIRDLSAYLMGQSRLPHLKERLLDFLLNENKAGTVVETAGHFVTERAVDFTIPLENEIQLAEDPAKFDELRNNREQLMERLERIRTRSQEILQDYDVKTRGGDLDGEHYSGYTTQTRLALREEDIEREVVRPMVQWLREDDNLKQARREQFRPLAAQLEHQVDEYISGVLNGLYETVESVESETRDAIAEQLGEVRELRMNMLEPENLQIGDLSASLTGSYVAFTAGGAALGVAAGAAIGTPAIPVPVIGTAIGAGIGGLIGAVGGFLTRLAWSQNKWIQKLEPRIRENAMNMVLHGVENEEGIVAPPIVDTLCNYLDERASEFRQTLDEEVNGAITTVQRECDDLLEREEQIRRESEAIVARLRPKVEMLRELHEAARGYQAEETETAEERAVS